MMFKQSLSRHASRTSASICGTLKGHSKACFSSSSQDWMKLIPMAPADPILGLSEKFNQVGFVVNEFV